MSEAVANTLAPAGERPSGGQGRLKVLAIAYACDPEKGSEEGVGWGWVRHIAERHDVSVITASFNLRFRYVRHRSWHYKPEGAWLKIENSPLKPLMNLTYQCWLGDALESARRLALAERFDLVHLITYVGYRFAGRFWTLGIPFVWGPVGGLENTPWRLLPLMGWRGAFFYACRNVVNSVQLALLPGPRRAFLAAHGAVIAATSGIQKAIAKHYKSPSTVICEIGARDAQANVVPLREPGSPLVICWSGTHLPGKALPLLLGALAALPGETDWQLRILGDGPENKRWRRMAMQLGIAERCSWHGWLPQSHALDEVGSSHVFAITSLKDLTSTVALEALSLGVPILCLDHCGFADAVTDACGIKIAVESPQQIVSGFAAAIGSIERDEPRRRRLGWGALDRAAAYSWQAKMDALDRIYQQATQRSDGAKASTSAAGRANSLRVQ
jgi:glycosyltransferase involved in cell wall biosynthesis